MDVKRKRFDVIKNVKIMDCILNVTFVSNVVNILYASHVAQRKKQEIRFYIIDYC